MKKVRDIGTIVAGLALATGLTVASPASATHATCEQMGYHFISDVIAMGPNVVGHGDAYGEPGMVATKDYIKCVEDAFDAGNTGYRLEVIEQNPEYMGGTTYTIQNK